MSEVHVRRGETIDEAIARFNMKLKKNGVIIDTRRHDHYMKPSVKKKNKAEAARRRKR